MPASAPSDHPRRGAPDRALQPSGPAPTRRMPTAEQEAVIEQAVVLAFAPVHKRAFGVAAGTVVALLMVVLTLADLALDPHRYAGLLGVYFAGYEVSPRGALVGGAWGFMVGFVAGWFMAFCRNFFLAAWLLAVRAHEQLKQSRDILDHI